MSEMDAAQPPGVLPQTSPGDAQLSTVDSLSIAMEGVEPETTLCTPSVDPVSELPEPPDAIPEPLPSPVHLRKRRPPSTDAFDPSRCPQCGTGSMCGRCRAILEKEKEKAHQPPHVSTSPVVVATTNSKQSKKAADHGKKSSAASTVFSSPKGAVAPRAPAKSKSKKASSPHAPRLLAGAAAQSHALRVSRMLEQFDADDYSTSSKMFAFIEKFLGKCPSDQLDSFVRLNSGENQMTAFGNLTYRQLANHLFGLRVEHVQRLVRPVLHRLMVHPKNNEMFNQPVDPDALGIPTYFDVVEQPMDLGTVKGRLQRGGYQHLDDCVAEISLVFDNATLFNPPGHVVHEVAVILRNDFNAELTVLKEKLDKEAERKAHHACSLCQGSCCYLCGEKCLRVEPPILVCHGPCGQKIKKNCIYYVSRDGFMLWCQKCHSGLPTIAAERSGKPSILKRDLLKRRLDEEVAESWVRCDTCQRWVHQVCALFNDRFEAASAGDLNNKMDIDNKLTHSCGASVESVGEETKFECPLCKLKDAIGERVEVKPLPLSPPPIMLPIASAPAAAKITAAETVAPLLSSTSVSLHGRNRKRPAALADGDFVIIPLKQAHTTRTLSGAPDQAAKISQNKRGRVDGPVDKLKSVGATSAIVNKSRKKDVVPSGKKQKLLNGKGGPKEKEPAVEVTYILKAQSRRGRKPKYRINLGKPEEFNTNLGDANAGVGVPVEDDEASTVGTFPVRFSDGDTGAGAGDSNSQLYPPPLIGISTKKKVLTVDMKQASENSVEQLPESGEGNSGEPTQIDLSVAKSSESLGENDLDESTDRNMSGPMGDISDNGDYKRDGVVYSYCSTAMELAEEEITGVSDEPSTEPADVSPQNLDVKEKTKLGPITTFDELIQDFGHRQWTAAGLPRTKLGDFLECLVRARLVEMGKSSSVADSVYVRMISNSTHKLEVPSALRENFPTPAGYNLPRYIPYRQKCIVLFQRIQGNDICLFCLYVQEFDESCPEPNRSRVYVAYLDSIEYFRPRDCRTMVYHEILAGYLKWAQARGFEHCHIWACPPQRGDNFIFWCHPPHQRTPSRDRLTSWYNIMLRRASSLNAFTSDGLKNAWSVFFRQYGGRENDSQPRLSGRPVSYAPPARGGSKRGRGGRKQGGRGRIAAVSIAPSVAVCPDSESVADGYHESHAQVDENAPSMHRTSSTESLTASDNGIIKGKLVQPRCPPIFEGDFWVNECIRIHRFMETRARIAAAELNATTAVSSAGPMADKVVNHRAARDMMKRIMSKPLAYPFLLPVDHVALRIPDYPKIVKEPMDLGTIKGKLKAKLYPTLFEFAEDMRLTFNNSILYNPDTHPIHTAAVDFLTMFTQLLVDFVTLKMSANLTPSPQESTEGLDVWLKKFQLTNVVSTEVLTDDPPFASKDGTVSQGGLIDATHRMPPQFDSNEEDIDADKSEVDPNQEHDEEDTNDIVSAEDERPSEASLIHCCSGLDGVSEYADEDSPISNSCHDNCGCPNAEAARAELYPAPVGFCRQDSVPDLSSSMARSTRHLSSSNGDTFVRSNVSLMPSGSIVSAGNGQAETGSKYRNDGAVTEGDKFQGAALGLKGVCALMHEMSKASLRFKDDLFVIKLSGSPLKQLRSEVKLQPGGGLVKSEAASLWKDWLLSSNMDPEVFLPLFDGTILSGDTADPDVIMPSPFVDSRHTFLEMCQYRHYQFDSLRRAKHSSMMLLYHLHHPSMTSLRPICVSCQSIIKEIRWHCELCDHYDLCARCVAGKVGAEHQHPLIPFRVTYV